MKKLKNILRVITFLLFIFALTGANADLSDVPVPVSGKVVKSKKGVFIVEEKLTGSQVTYVIKGGTFGLEAKKGYSVTVLGVVKDTSNPSTKTLRIKKVLNAKKGGLLDDMTSGKKGKKRGSLIDDMTKGRKSLID